MSWRDLLVAEGEELLLPWAGGKQVHSLARTWTIQGRRPPEHGWYTFEVSGGRTAKLKSREPQEADPSFIEAEQGGNARFRIFKGYVVGDRFIQDGAGVDPDPDKLIEQTKPVFCVPLGLDRFTRAQVFLARDGRHIYLQQEWPDGPETEVLAAYQDRKDSVTEITGVTPALDLAFRWISWGRERAEERAREMERLRQEELARLEQEERIRKAMEDAGTGAGRRALAQHDFETAARLALQISGAELLDVRDSHNRNEKVVQYRFRQRRLECTVDKVTLRIIDAGVCLDDHRGEKGDTYFTLESLPPVIGEALDLGKLVVWRHVGEDDPDYEYDEERW